MRIIYQNPDNSVAILAPSDNTLKACTIEDIAQKDVPAGRPYWIVDDADIETDRLFRDAWEISDSIGVPNGVGGVSDSFSPAIIKDYRITVLGMTEEDADNAALND